MAQSDLVELVKREAERRGREVESEAVEREERSIAEWFGWIEDVAETAMRAAGYHEHKGQRLRRRNVRGEPTGAVR